jgi:hypothetical protein
MTETAVVVYRGDVGKRYPPEIRDLAYEIWAYKADRNATRTRQLLIEMLRADAEAEGIVVDVEDLPVPSERMMQKWVKDGNWAQKVTEDIASIAPRLWKEFNARLFAQVEAAQAFDGDVLAGKYDYYDKPGILATKEKVAARIQTLAGIGTAAGLSPVSMPAPSAKPLEEGLSTQEISRRSRDRLLERKGEGR